MAVYSRLAGNIGRLLAAALLLSACNSPDTSRPPASSSGAAPPFMPATGPTADPAAASPGAQAGAATASSPAPVGSVPAPADSARYLLSPGRVGALRLNMKESALLETIPYERLRPTKLSIEGIDYPAYELPDPSRPSAPPLLLEMVGDSLEGFRLWRVQVRDPRYRTAAGLGVGSPFGAVVQQHGVSTVELGDAGLVAISDQMRMSWVLDRAGLPRTHRGPLRVADIPAATRVTAVLLFR